MNSLARRLLVLSLLATISILGTYPMGRELVFKTISSNSSHEEVVRGQMLACTTGPDFRIDASSVVVSPPTCPDTDFTVDFDIDNNGDLAFSGNLEVSFYSGDPTQAGAIFLNTEVTSLTGFNPGNLVNLSLPVTGTGSAFDLYIVVNDAGVTTPPIIFPTTTQAECAYNDNIASVQVNPNPFTVSLEKIQDNTKCDILLPNNGAARAFVLEGTTEVIAGYTFDWYRFGTLEFTGPIYNGMQEGDYQVVATHDAAQCQSDTANITIIRDNASSPVLEIVQNRLFDDCRRPNGKATIKVVNPSNPSGPGLAPGKYEFLWFEGNQVFLTPPMGTSHVENSLYPIFYSVYVKDKKTGCDNIATILIEDDPLAYPVPDIVVTPVTSCTADNGAVSATVNGQTNPNTFEWFIGSRVKPSADFITPDVNNLPAGDYTLVVTNNKGCPSDPVTVTVEDQRIMPVINITMDAPQTSCDPTTPNGAASAVVDESAQGGGNSVTTGYTFEWFSGQTTSGPTVATGPSVVNLSSGTHTVLVTNTNTGCSNSEEIIILENLVTPVPTVAITDQDACIPPNGSLSATVGGVTTGYSFYWFIGNVGAPSLGSADYTTASVLNLTAGDYTLVVVDDNIQCQSAPQVHNIADNTSQPTINLVSQTDQTSCDPASETGAFSVNANGSTSGFTFQWFTGQNTLPANEITPSPGASITGLGAGTYTVLATNNSTGCFATAEYTIVENLVIPVPAVVITDQDACLPPNGGLSATVGGTTTGYSFYWFIGNVGAPSLGSADYTAASVLNLTAGDYTLVVVDDNTQCQSVPAVHNIADNTSLPTINLVSQTDQVSCDPANPTGSISVNANGSTSGFTFQWFTGQNTIPVNEITPSPGASITGLNIGTYTVLVTNTSTGCSATSEYTIVENLVIPGPAVVITDQDACIPPNGGLSATVNGTTTGYSFYWFIGNAGTPNLAGADFTTASVSNLTAGEYTLVAVDDNTQCQSLPQVVNIADNTVLPSINLISQTDQQSCDPGNPTGSISVEADGTTTGYTFQWFNGQNTLPANEISPTPGATITGLSAGIYTVLVTNNSTGCTESAEYTILENLVTPVPSVAITDQGTCVPPDGALVADVGGTTTGFSFYWFIGNVAMPNLASADFTTASVTGLIAGDYTLVVVDDATQCESVPQVHNVADNTVLPTINVLAQTDQTSCDPANPNGGISVDADGSTAGYTFQWFNGQNTLPANEITPSPGSIISGLDNGIYTVLAINDATGCQNTLEITLSENIVIPTITATPVHQTDCAPLNGSISVVVSTGLPGDYTFSWYDGNVVKASPDYSETGNVLNSLAAGIYTVEAINNLTNCPAAPVTVTVEDNTPAITITRTDIIKPSDCSTAAGELEVLASSAGSPPFSYEWYRGRPPFGAGSIGNAARITGLTSDLYTVVVTNLNNGCQADSTFDLPFDGAPEVLVDVLGIVPNTSCDTNNYNGELNVQIDPSTLAVTDPGDDQNEYLLHLYVGSNPVGVPITFTSPAVFTGLAPGDYSIVAEQNFVPNCPSVPILVNIPDASALPILNAVQNIPNTNCSPTAPNGLLEVEIDGGASPLSYTINWFEGPDTSSPSLGTTAGVTAGTNQERAEQLPGGLYTVEVINNSDMCASTATYQVLDSQPVVSITQADLTITPQDDCTPENGSVMVNSVREDGVPVAYNGTNYDFEWYDTNLNPLAAPLPANSYTGLAAGTYYVVAINNSTGCRSSQVAIDIEDQTVLPVVTLSVAQPNVSCDVANPTGHLISGVTGNLADYTIEWFIGENNTTNTLPIANVSGANGEEAIDLSAGFYTVRYTDNTNPGIGCLAIATMEIVDDPAEMTITQADLTITPQDDCTPENGSVMVNSVREDGVPVAYNGTNYDFEWYDTNLNPLAAPLPANSYTGLAAGTYYVVAINNSTGCRSSQVAIDIEDQTVLPVVTLSVAQPNVSCDVANPTGHLISGVTGNLADYTIEWFIGENNTTNTLPIANVSGANGEEAIDLSAGFYTVRYTDNTNPGIGCLAIATMEIVDDPAEMTLTQAEIFSHPQENCTPANGGIRIESVREDGVPVVYNGTNYNFEYYDTNLNLLPPPPVANDYTGLLAGRYYVVAINTVTGCRTDQVEVNIPDETVPPVISLSSFTNPTSCDGLNQPGSLIVEADGISDVALYTYEWYSGGQPVSGAPIVANNFVANNLNVGTYTVVVTNNTTGCTSEASYTLQTEAVVPVVSSSSEPVTNCDMPNGSLFATVINTVATYNFNWYAGTDTTVAPLYTGQTVDNVSPGLYTVIAVDQADPGCVSLSDTVSIQDLRFVGFEVQIQAVAPLSNCDPTNPNGILSATVNGDVTSHEFEWYLGTDLNAPPVTIGSIATGLTDTLYTVVARDVITQCENTAEYTLGSEFLPVPTADIVMTDATSCITDNGAMQATVGGNVKDYTFDWYPGDQVMGTPIFTGPDLVGLANGQQYTVTATSNATGCTSPGVTATVGENIILPEFEIEINNATCLDQNGSAIVHVFDTTNVSLIQWSNGVTGPELMNYPAGRYTVTVTDTLGCESSQEVDIESEINVFNGVSPNGDGFNDIFHIDCIESFPNNIVHIYNRAGQLVYRHQGYNNSTVFFDGIGNEGTYLSGNQLPDGTYYYVVDKRNGSEPVAGYLELLR